MTKSKCFYSKSSIKLQNKQMILCNKVFQIAALFGYIFLFSKHQTLYFM